MKKVLFPLIAIFAISFTASAQGKMGKQKHQHRQQKGMMAKELNLTEAQKAQAKAINEDSRKQMQELNKNENITVKEMRSRKAAIQQEKKTKMEGILTAEQKAKKAELIKVQKVKREEKYAKRMDKMKTDLNLTDAQVSKLNAQRSATQAKAEKIKADDKLSVEQKREKMKALKVDAKKQHDQIYTPEQLAKIAEMKKNRKTRKPGERGEQRQKREKRGNDIEVTK